MRLSKCLICCIIGLFCLYLKPVQANNKAIFATTEADNEMFYSLLKRIELLERRNGETEKKMEQLAHDFETKERLLTDRIAELEKINDLRNSDDNDNSNVPDKRHDMLQDDEQDKGGNIEEKPEPKQTRINKLGSIQRRATVESEAAFFATVTPHDVDHLGQNQNIVFDNAVTNIGNAYHTNHGIFTAPADGTYVFCATVAGRQYAGQQDYYAHFDVNGRVLARFITHPQEQSTQTIVVQLQAGDDVSIKNDRADDGILGDKYSSFAGFLLFQNFDSSTNILGK
ncbi:uncharacterized protein LOC123555669 [Mercenaria mercenaria]|uniref:uncharacterized protein LOC123555669 n=1 Tax=Mercenaria mercenaria TaxID=6596 RepID=UPI00234F6175|nr:uncharacterized protein LOC123555669 [Mercenaria mercenaria]